MSGRDNVSDNALAAVDAVVAKAQSEKLDQPCLNFWVTEVLGRFTGVAERFATRTAVDGLMSRAKDDLASGKFGDPLSVDEVLERSAENASSRGAGKVVARDLVVTVLRAAGLDLATEAPPDAPAEGAAKIATKAADAAGGATSTAEQAWSSPEKRPTPTIDKFGRDLTEEAKTGKIHLAFGRESETETLIEVLCRTQKRNPLLIGPAGSGKTAIVESFACRVSAGEVPELLRDVRVVGIDMTTLVGGTGLAGSFEERIQKIIREASQPQVILFLDEAHTAAGAGPRGSEMADALKPALARGELALVAATTDDEYRQYIKPDRALERRFQPIAVSELGLEATLEIMRAKRDLLAEERGVTVPDAILADLVGFADENLKNRTFPDKALDLLEQCVANAVAQGSAIVDADKAFRVLSRIVGALMTPEEAIARVAPELAAAGIDAAATEQIERRLTATLNGLDLRTQRPNLVLALTREASAARDAIARALARALFDAEERVIVVDLSQIHDDHAISVLIGSMPGYVGYGRRLPIHSLEVTPRSVVVFTGADVCHPLATDIVANGMAEGYIADTAGTRYYLSDAVVLVPTTRARVEDGKVSLGFVPEASASEESFGDSRDYLERAFGAAIADQIDLCISRLGEQQATARGAGLMQSFLPDMVEKFNRRGIDLTWDDSLVSHLGSLGSGTSRRSDLERLAEEWLSNAVMPAVKHVGPGKKCRVRLTVVDGNARASVEEK